MVAKKVERLEDDSNLSLKIIGGTNA